MQLGSPSCSYPQLGWVTFSIIVMVTLLVCSKHTRKLATQMPANKQIIVITHVSATAMQAAMRLDAVG